MTIDFSVQTRAFLGLYELELNRHLRRLCLPGTRSFDVGAQFGYDALILAKLGEEQVASFEPDPASLEVMIANFALNPMLGPLIYPVQALVGTGSGNTLSLDDYVASAEGFMPDFVKVDVDGAEAEVLEGARRLLAERRPHLLVEVHSEHLERVCGRLLVDHGYRPIIVNQRTVLREYRPIAHNRWLVADGSPR